MGKYLLTFLLIITTIPVLWSQDVVKVVTYNVLNYPNSSNTNQFGNDAARVIHFQEIMEHINPDVILLQEIRNLQGADMLLNALNNSTILSKSYQRAPVLNTFDSSGGNMVFYNTSIFSLVAQTVIPVTNTTQAPDGDPVETPRPATIFQIVANPPSDPQTNITMYFVSVHLKGGDEGETATEIADNERRELGVRDIMDYINANLTTSDHIVVTGDMNFYGASNEPGYAAFTSDVTYPILLHHPPGEWFRNSNTYVNTYTQSTRAGANNQFGNGGAGGGLDDRFDLMLFSENLLTQNNEVTYVGNSYESVGNGGDLNDAVTAGNSPIASQLLYMSDHHPVVMELELKGSDVEEPTCGEFPITMECVGTTIDFTNFNGSGFSANPQVGELCSKDWTVSGFTDSYQPGGENTSGDFARGTTVGDETQGGIYSRNGSIWIQPTGSDFTPGELVLKICNTSGATMEDVEIAYDLTVFNDEPRSNSFNFSYSFDNAFFTTVPALNYTSPASPDESTTLIQRAVTVEGANLAADACLYLRWQGDDVGGSGARDEFGLDNIKVCSEHNTQPTLLTINGPMIASGIYGVADTILATGTVGVDSIVTFEASTAVILQDGFAVENGGTFTAQIVPPATPAGVAETQLLQTAQTPAIAQKQESFTQVNVFPNPAGDFMTVQFQLTEGENISLEMLDMLGKRHLEFAPKAFDSGLHDIDLDLNHVPAGMYYLVLRTEDYRLTQKVMVH